MNPIIVPVRNNVHLTRKAIASFRKQDIVGGVDIFVINNASTDGTNEYLSTQLDIVNMYYDPMLSVAASWNLGLKLAFKMGAPYALVVNNDVELLPQTYSFLCSEEAPFVTAIGSAKPLPEDGGPASGFLSKRPHPDFSCFLIRKELYETIGPFDENFNGAFCEDGDYDLRMFKAGIRAYCIDLPFLHHGSATVKNADPSEVRRIQLHADKNRQYFKKKWGFEMGSKEYYDALQKGGPDDQM